MSGRRGTLLLVRHLRVHPYTLVVPVASRADGTGESIEEALEAVLNTEAGTQLRELRDLPHDEESVEEW